MRFSIVPFCMLLVADGGSAALARRAVSPAPKYDAVQTRLLRTGAVLVGQSSSTELVISIDPPEQRHSQPQLTLQWEVSAIVDAATSTLTVELDDAPISTVTVGKRPQERTLELPLPEVSGGFHVVRIRTRLFTGPDPCHSPYDRESWLRILPTSELTYQRLLRPETKGTIAGLAAHWRQLDGAVAVLPPPELDGGSACAYLNADALLRGLGLRPSLRREDQDGAAVVMRTDATAEQPEALRQPAVLGMLRRVGSRLEVIARDSQDLGAALQRLVQTQLLARCEQSVCLIARTTEDPSGLGSPKAPSSPSATVARIGELGHPHGWTARGPGWHVLHLSWQRPPTWIIEDAPEIELYVSASAGAELDRLASSLTVRMGDRPLASFSPASITEQQPKISVKLPRDLWEQPTWSIDIEVTLRGHHTEHCQGGDDEAMWLTLGSETGISVQRSEQKYPGTLAGLPDAAHPRSPMAVISRDLTWPVVAALAAVAAPLAGGRPWLVTESVAGCRGLCMIPQLGALPESEPLALIPIGSELHWFDKAGTLALPLLSARSGIYLHLLSAAPGQGSASELVSVHFPAAYELDPALESPSYALLPVERALFAAGGWLALGRQTSPGAVVEVKAPKPAAAAPGARPARAAAPSKRWLDGAWLVGSLLVILLMLRLAKRKRKAGSALNF